MKYLALIFLIVFLWFAYLQINDPDPIWWITVYLVAAYVSYKAFRNEYSFELLRILIVLYLSYALTSWLGMTKFEGFFTEGEGMEMKTMNQELAREACGLGICIFVFLIYTAQYFRKKV
ncbi:MAG: transmembrane 220 family protein [Bacteroidota bacterium]|nr:transmembrane 220 family protein [Bacteroidota bacterium]